MGRRKTSNDPLAILIAAFLALPFVLAAIFKIMFKIVVALIAFIGQMISKYQQYKNNRPYCDSSCDRQKHKKSFDSKISYTTEEKRNIHTSYHDSEEDHRAPRSHERSAAHSSLYEALRAPGDPDPDLTLERAPQDDAFDEEDIVFYEEPFDVDVSDSDITIMGLALYDALMHGDD